MKKFNKSISFFMALVLFAGTFSITAHADNSKVVTLGANLSDDQKASMYEYFGTNANEVVTIEVTNADERKYMEGIASESQIGTRSLSCSYVEPTNSGGIQVKVANLSFVTSSMIASTLMTSGVENCNVIAASPIEVSGTGALTGIMMAYETATGEELSEEQKEAAVEELVATGELADEIGQEEATDLMNEIKEEVIKENLSDPEQIEQVIEDAASEAGVTLTDEQMSQLIELMEKISKFDIDVNALKDTLENLVGQNKGFFENLFSSLKGLIGGNDSDGGILNETNDEALGSDAIIDSTLDAVKDTVKKAEEEGLIDKLINFVKGLIGEDTSSEE